MNYPTPYQEDLKKSLVVLRKGGLLLYPTDTIWGLGCDPENAAAIDRLFAVKNRPANKTLLLLAGSLAQVRDCVAVMPKGLGEVLQGQSRPLTVIYPGAKGPAKLLAASDGTVGIRVTTDEFCRDLALEFGKPIVSTSANLSGESFTGGFEGVASSIRELVDYTVTWKQDTAVEGRPSRIVKPDRSGGWTILRD